MHELTDVDVKILEKLTEGRNVPGNISRDIDYSNTWIHTRLQQMESAGYVENIGCGVYELHPLNIPDEERMKVDLANMKLTEGKHE